MKKDSKKIIAISLNVLATLSFLILLSFIKEDNSNFLIVEAALILNFLAASALFLEFLIDLLRSTSLFNSYNLKK